MAKSSKVKQLVAGAQMMSPRLAQRFAVEKQSASNRAIVKPDLRVKNPPLTMSKLGNQTKASQTLRPDPGLSNPGPNLLQRPDL